jgi:hypothetical protein
VATRSEAKGHALSNTGPQNLRQRNHNTISNLKQMVLFFLLENQANKKKLKKSAKK